VKSDLLSSKSPTGARDLAFVVLSSVQKKVWTLDAALAEMDQQHQLGARDRSLLNALVFGVLRWRGYLDFIIDHFSKKGLHQIAPDILSVIRIGLFQMIYLDRVPAHAAVNTSVEMAKKQGAEPWVAGFVNAVLKNAGQHHDTVSLPDERKDPVAYLSVSRSFPRWMIKRWINRMGYRETKALCDAVNTIPPITVRTNTLKTNRKALMTMLKGHTSQMQASSFAPDGITFFDPDLPISQIPAFQKGWFQVQDEAAQMVAMLLTPRPGERVMDACAGFGGKTGTIAQMMKNTGKVVALDRSQKKLTALADEMKRLGVSIVSAIPYHIQSPLTIDSWGIFDRVFLDAPCSGLGVVRRNPDIKWRITESKLKPLHNQQVGLLHCLSGIVKKGGVLVYAVCTTEPEETVEVIGEFLRKHRQFKIRRPSQGHPKKWKTLMDKNGFLETAPHLHGMDGFFAVGLQRVKE
jgi:16S rRNA (cytosine967-C5)-methyltransferase